MKRHSGVGCTQTAVETRVWLVSRVDLSEGALERVALEPGLKGQVEFQSERSELGPPPLQAGRSRGGWEWTFPLCLGMAGV